MILMIYVVKVHLLAEYLVFGPSMIHLPSDDAYDDGITMHPMLKCDLKIEKYCMKLNQMMVQGTNKIKRVVQGLLREIQRSCFIGS